MTELYPIYRTIQQSVNRTLIDTLVSAEFCERAERQFLPLGVQCRYIGCCFALSVRFSPRFVPPPFECSCGHLIFFPALITTSHQNIPRSACNSEFLCALPLPPSPPPSLSSSTVLLMVETTSCDVLVQFVTDC